MLKAVSAICWGSVADFSRCCFLWSFWIIIHISASHYYYSNSSIDLTVEFSKCYLLGQFELTESTECNQSHIAMGIQPRPPQRKTLMILFLISASLWGCLGCQIFVKSKSVPVDFVFLRIVQAYQFFHQHYPNTGTDSFSKSSKCYLLG